MALPPASAIKKICVTGKSGTSYSGCFLDVGVPHTALQVLDVDKVDVEVEGKHIRNCELFAPKGFQILWLLLIVLLRYQCEFFSSSSRSRAYY